jgi:hypothetical protein
VKPVLQALVLAERVYEDKGGQKIIAGTFNGFRFSRSSPVQEVVGPDGVRRKTVKGGVDVGSPWAYLSLTDVWDDTKLEFQFVSLTKNQVIFRTELLVQCDDRLATVEIVVPLPKLNVPESGIYAFEVLCEGEIIGSHRIIAEEIKES